MNNLDDIRDRMEGCMWGQAIGDALGLGTEFMSRNEVKFNYPKGLKNYDKIIRDAHRRRWPRGAWTDDTDMMLCVLDGYADGKFQPSLIARNFKKWFDGKPVGIGRHTFNVLYFDGYIDNPVFAAETIWKINRCRSAANGAIMRTSIFGLKKDITPEEISDVCILTHPDSRCIGSCVIISMVINKLIWQNENMSIDEILAHADKYDDRIAEWVRLAYEGDLADLELDNPEGMGYTLRTLAAALWAYWHAVDIPSGLLNIVNEGGDADTNAAVATALLGAKFGKKAIPAKFIEGLHRKDWYEKRVDYAVKQFLSDNPI